MQAWNQDENPGNNEQGVQDQNTNSLRFGMPTVIEPSMSNTIQ